MIGKNETSPSVFTEAGEQWVEEMVEALRNNDYDRSRELGQHKSWNFTSLHNGRVPDSHPDFGRLVKQSAGSQYLVASTHRDSQDVTKKNWPGSALRDTHPTYTVENFGKVRIYSEAVARDVDHLFCPITGWDGQDFRWVTMPLLKNISTSDGRNSDADVLRQKLKSEDQNWVIHDEEVGERNGTEFLLDYGMFWYDGQWKISESQLFD